MNENEYTEEQILEELLTIFADAQEMERQYELYCQMMKQMFLAGSTNN